MTACGAARRRRAADALARVLRAWFPEFTVHGPLSGPSTELSLQRKEVVAGFALGEREPSR